MQNYDFNFKNYIITCFYNSLYKIIQYDSLYKITTQNKMSELIFFIKKLINCILLYEIVFLFVYIHYCLVKKSYNCFLQKLDKFKSKF